jgi:polar amino acid transport system substrate-binding protein
MAIEVLEEAARRLKEPLTIELMPLARALSQTRHRQNVLLVPPVKSPQRESLFLWIAPLLDEAFVLVSHRQHHPEPLSVKALPGLTIGVMRGSYGQSLIQPLGQVKQDVVAEGSAMPASWRWIAFRAGPWPGTAPVTISSRPACR